MQHRILIVAHDTALRASLARLLQQEGFAVELAAAAKRARELVIRTTFELAIVGLDEEKVIGSDLARWIGQAVGRLVLVRLGGRSDDRSPDSTCDAYISGPLDEGRILAEIRSVLRPQHDRGVVSADPSVLLRFDAFTLDVAGRSLLDGAQREVPLTPSEFALLIAFARAPGRVLSRDHLRNEVAGHALDPYDRSIDMLVGRLRRKIEPDPKAPRHIVTFPGAGYKFTAKVQETMAADGLVSRTAGQSPQPADSLPDALLQELPALAVLPFQNLSGDPGQDYFADGLVEEIITALSRGKWFLVMARNSSFTYKGRAVDVKQVGRELGVQYVLEGSVRKSGQRVRITTQLVEAESGTPVWAEKYDGAVEDIFDFQDHITACVVAAIEPHLRDAEIKRGQRRRPDGAIECFARNLRLGPLDTRNFTSLCGMSWALIMAGRSNEAIGWGRKCIAANPLWLSGHKMLAIALANVGHLAEAREVAAHVMSIDQFSNLSHALRLMKPGPGRDRYIEGGRKAGFPD